MSGPRFLDMLINHILFYVNPLWRPELKGDKVVGSSLPFDR